MVDPIAHLHVHTEYSMLDGMTRVDELVEAVAKDNGPAVAITDHGVLFGLVDFYKAAKKGGVKPILGSELYQAPENRFAMTKQGPYKQMYYHLSVLAQNDVGYQNLMALSSNAYLEGYYYKPRMDKELLAQHAEGLIILSGCLGSELNQHILNDSMDAARQTISDFIDICGKDNYFIELQDHGLEEDRKVLPECIKLAKEFGVRTVAANDSHYTHRDQAAAHDALLCIGTGSKLQDEKRFRFKGDEFYVKTAEQMRELFRDHPESCDNTLLVAEMVNVELQFDQDLLPKFPTSEGRTEDEQLAADVYAGARERYGNDLSDEVRERIDYELRIIAQMGFPAYFLIVADLCDWARANGIRVGPGRGSAGGSVVAYCTGITQVDPIRFGLIFERFLNPSRIQMPDIDMDFDDRGRGQMITYAAERYGSDQVAQVVTFGTIKAKSAIRDAARVLDEPFALGDNLTKAFPPAQQGQEATLDEALEKSGEMQSLIEADPAALRVIDTARSIENLKRHHGIHAAAVIIGAKPLVETVPVMRTDKGETVTQYEMNACEALGLLKMDFLGLRNLTVIQDAEQHILANRGITVDLDSRDLPLDDTKTFEALSTGDTLGVFQLDSPGMQALVRKLKPDSFEDIVALLALYRPGPLSMDMHLTYAERKHGREAVTYDHEDLKPILQETYGVIVYQEQVMRIAVDICGFTMADSDLLRKAVGKKKRDLMEKMKAQFIDGAAANGYERRLAVDLWGLIEKFAEYGFNKSHTVAYGLISYQTAWLKAHYPVEYMAALLTSVKNNKDAKPIYLGEARRMGIDVLPPDVNESLRDFTPTGEDIRFGMSAVRGVGDAVVDGIVAARREHGRFEDFRDFCEKVDAGVLNKRVIEALIKAGAFESLGHTRRGLLAVFEQLVESMASIKKAQAAGQSSLFDMGGDDGEALEIDDGVVIEDHEFDKTTLLTLEREMLGLYVSDHPLSGAERALEQYTKTSILDLKTVDDAGNALIDDKAQVVLAGVLTSLSKGYTRKGDAYLNATLEDLTGEIECVFWPSTYRTAFEVLEEDAILVLHGRVERRDAQVKLTVDKVTAPDLSEALGAPIVVTLQSAQATPESLSRLKSILTEFPGVVGVHLELHHEDDTAPRLLELGPELRCERSTGLFGSLKAAFGPDAVIDLRDRTFEGEERPAYPRRG